VLLSADGLGTVQIMRRTGWSKPTVWRWQARFSAEGVDGLLRDKTRPPGKKPLAASVIRQVVTKTTTEKPPTATHWTARAMAKAVGIAVSSVQKIWQAHGLKPHQVRTFKLSNDPAFEEKLVDIVGLYLDPPDKALVLAVDEKSQIQALDRTQPGLPLKKGHRRDFRPDCASGRAATPLPIGIAERSSNPPQFCEFVSGQSPATASRGRRSWPTGPFRREPAAAGFALKPGA
jgi:transposase